MWLSMHVTSMISTAFPNILSDEILYTRKMKEKKKKKVTKKIGKKHSNYKTGKKAKWHKEDLDMDSNHIKDNMDISSSGGVDTLYTNEKKKKTKSPVWMK